MGEILGFSFIIVHGMIDTGGFEMGATGKADKGKKEQRKKPKLTIKEKRKQKQEKKSGTSTL